MIREQVQIFELDQTHFPNQIKKKKKWSGHVLTL